MGKRRSTVFVAMGLWVVGAVACEGLGGLAGGDPPPDAGAPLDDGAVAPSLDADACPPGYRDCDHDPANGCETRVTESASHCGFCGNVCPAAANGYPVCVDGACRVGCNKGFDNCDRQDSNGCEQNVTSDKDNCGACAHACGGNCANGLCEPTTVPTGGLDTPDTLAVGQPVNAMGTVYHQIYFRTGANAIHRVAINGGAPAAIAGAIGTTIPRIQLDGGRLYFFAGSDLAWCEEPCTVTPPRPVHRRALPTLAGDFSLADPMRGFSTAWDPFGSNIYSFAKAALTPADAAVPTTQLGMVGPMMPAIAEDPANVYVGTDQSIYVASKDGGPLDKPRAIADASVPRGGLTVGGDRLFFISGTKLFGCVANDCLATRKVYGNASNGYGVATDGQFVYWADPGTASQAFQDGQILRCPLSGCIGAPTVFAIAQHRPAAITLTATEVYWTTQGNQTSTAGSIVRIAK